MVGGLGIVEGPDGRGGIGLVKNQAYSGWFLQLAYTSLSRNHDLYLLEVAKYSY